MLPAVPVDSGVTCGVHLRRWKGLIAARVQPGTQATLPRPCRALQQTWRMEAVPGLAPSCTRACACPGTMEGLWHGLMRPRPCVKLSPLILSVLLQQGSLLLSAEVTGLPLP